ncbi:hypothetical protein [Niabella aquatica]
MSVKSQINRLALMHQLISREKTGGPLELAKKIKVSERQVHNYLSLLKEMELLLISAVKVKLIIIKKRAVLTSGFVKIERPLQK